VAEVLLEAEERSCGDCTKCCEGWLTGTAHGHDFYPSKPCHFVVINKGCSIYKDRPKEPCQTFKCVWLSSKEIPEWMKPNKINAIITIQKINNHEYLSIKEAGEKLKTEVLNWLFLYAINNNVNLNYEINGGSNYFGSFEFLNDMQNENKKNLKK